VQGKIVREKEILNALDMALQSLCVITLNLYNAVSIELRWLPQCRMAPCAEVPLLKAVIDQLRVDLRLDPTQVVASTTVPRGTRSQLMRYLALRDSRLTCNYEML